MGSEAPALVGGLALLAALACAPAPPLPAAASQATPAPTLTPGPTATPTSTKTPTPTPTPMRIGVTPLRAIAVAGTALVDCGDYRPDLGQATAHRCFLDAVIAGAPAVYTRAFSTYRAEATETAQPFSFHLALRGSRGTLLTFLCTQVEEVEYNVARPGIDFAGCKYLESDGGSGFGRFPDRLSFPP